MQATRRKRLDKHRPDEHRPEPRAAPPWVDRPFRELLRLAWPIAVSMVSYALMTLVDTFFVGSLGSSALAGVGLGGTAAFALIVFTFGLMRGVKILTAQSIGAGNRGELGAYLGAGLGLALLLGVAVAVVGQLLAELLPLITASAAAGGHARAYLAVRSIGSPLALAYVALREYRYGRGDSRSPMWAAIAGNATNIALDWAFIALLGFGVTGVAWATIAGQGVQLGLVLGLQLRLGAGVGATRFRHVRAVWRMGLPTGLQFLIEMGSFALLAALLAALGDAHMAAHQIAIQVIHFTFLPILAVAEAGGVMTGQAVGAGRDELVRSVARQALAVAAGYAALWTCILLVGGPWIAARFTGEPALIEATAGLLYVAAAFQLFDAAYAVARSALQGTGDVRFPAVVGVALAWALTPPATWVLGWQLGMGALGGWLGILAEIVIGAGVMWWRLERLGWLRCAEQSRSRIGQEAEDGLLAA